MLKKVFIYSLIGTINTIALEIDPLKSITVKSAVFLTVDRNLNNSQQKPKTSIELPKSDRTKEVEIKNFLPLTLEESIELAKQNNRQLKIAQLNLEASRATLDEAKAALFPSVGLNSNLTRQLSPSGELSLLASQRQARQTISSSESQIPRLTAQLNSIQQQLNLPIDPNNADRLLERASLLIQQERISQQLVSVRATLQSARNQLDNLRNFGTTSINGTVGLDYTVLSFQRQANIDLARERLNFNELEVGVIEQQVRLETTLAYYDLQQADRSVRINEEDVIVRGDRLEGIELLLEAALATRLDLLNARIELNNSIQTLNNSLAQQETQRRNLARLLSLSPSVTPVAADPIAIAGRWNLSLEESIVLAIDNRIELKLRLSERRSAEAQRQLAIAGKLPQLSVFADYNVLQLYSDNPSDFVSSGFGDGYALGIELNWTLFDGGAANAGIRRAEANIEIANEQFADLSNQIRFEVERAFFQLPTQLENIQTADLALQQAREAVDAAQLRFQANISTQTEVLDAQNRLVRAENNFVDAILTYNRSLAELQRAIGN